MKILFVSGNEGAGKTPTCRALAERISNSYGYCNMSHLPAGQYDDFIKRYEGQNNSGHNINIFVCTASDSESIINESINIIENWCSENNINNNNVILINAARNCGDPIRAYQEQYILEHFPDSEIVEFPLARINNNGGEDLHNWYHEKVYEICIHILSLQPFNLF